MMFTYSRSVSDADLENIARNCRDLEQLDILGTNNVSATGLMRSINAHSMHPTQCSHWSSLIHTPCMLNSPVLSLYGTFIVCMVSLMYSGIAMCMHA